jgi:hypothetical protein
MATPNGHGSSRRAPNGADGYTKRPRKPVAFGAEIWTWGDHVHCASSVALPHPLYLPLSLPSRCLPACLPCSLPFNSSLPYSLTQVPPYPSPSNPSSPGKSPSRRRGCTSCCCRSCRCTRSSLACSAVPGVNACVGDLHGCRERRERFCQGVA